MKKTLYDCKTPGERLKYCRIKRHLTQAELAEKAGTKPNSIAQYENNNRQISNIKMIEFAEILDFNPIDLLPEFDQYKRVLKYDQSDMLLTEFFKVWKNLTPANKHRVLTLVCEIGNQKK